MHTNHRFALLLLALCLASLQVAAAEPSAAAGEPPPAESPGAPAPSSAANSPPEATEEAKFTTYVLGMRLSAPDLSRPGYSTKLRPTLGFRYGRWKIGSNSDVDSWLAFSGFRKEPTVAYDLRSTERLSTALSLRIHNLSTGTAFDAFETGRHTLRGRVLFGYQLDQRWSAGLELTRDLLNRGDGSTLSAGLSRGIPLDQRSLLTASAGLTWGSGTHWRTPNAKHPLGSTLHSGVGSLGLGLGYRYAITPAWAWYANLGASRATGQLRQIEGSAFGTSGQIGLLYFGRF